MQISILDIYLDLCFYCISFFKHFTKTMFCELVVVQLDLYMMHLCNDIKFVYLYIKLQQLCQVQEFVKFRTTKYEVYNFIKSRLFNTNFSFTIKNFVCMLICLKIKAFGGCKSQIFDMGLLDVESSWLAWRKLQETRKRFCLARRPFCES